MCSADAMILLGQGKESVEKFRKATLEVALLVREDINKQAKNGLQSQSFENGNHGLSRIVKDYQGLSRTIKDCQGLLWTVKDF